MKGAACLFGAVGFGCGPVLDLNGEAFTFILDRGPQVMGALLTTPSTASPFCATYHLSTVVRLVIWCGA